MNVFISDISRNKAQIFNGKTWNMANADEIVDTKNYMIKFKRMIKLIKKLIKKCI